jgi:hypothetical protein
MKEKSHRASEVCEKNVDKTILRTTTRRPDGYTLYAATALQVRQARGGQFDAEHASSDGGAVLLKAVDRQLG